MTDANLSVTNDNQKPITFDFCRLTPSAVFFLRVIVIVFNAAFVYSLSCLWLSDTSDILRRSFSRDDREPVENDKRKLFQSNCDRDINNKTFTFNFFFLSNRAVIESIRNQTKTVAMRCLPKRTIRAMMPTRINLPMTLPLPYWESRTEIIRKWRENNKLNRWTRLMKCFFSPIFIAIYSLK